MENDKLTLGNRMKTYYEDRYRLYLTRRTPAIIRIDGKSFHKYTKAFDRPFSDLLHDIFIYSTIELSKQIQGFKCAYLQSDEVSILLTDYDNLYTHAWFDYNIQKIVSVTSSLFTGCFNFFSYITRTHTLDDLYNIKIAAMDCRVFNIPEHDVNNYFIWRQQDWVRNSIQMLGRQYFSDSQLFKKKNYQIHELLHSIGVNWTDLDDRWKNGTFIIKQDIIQPCPIFTKDSHIIENLLIKQE